MNGVLELVAKIKTPTKKPTLTIANVKSLSGLTKIDTLVFKAISEASLDTGIDWVNISQLADTKEELGISEEDLFESIDILADNFYIKGQRVLDGSLDFFQITTYGFEQYAAAFLPDFNSTIGQVLLSITNERLSDNKAISDQLKQPLILVEYALDILANRNFIKISKTMGGGVSIHEVTAQGRRTARGLQAE